MIKENILGDNIGYVLLVDKMGDDNSIAFAARVSYQKGTKSVNPNEKLIDYLMQHDHKSPFEMVIFKFEIKMPIFLARQFFRYRTASFNETSLRYSEAEYDFYIPQQWRGQAVKNKQASDVDKTIGINNDNIAKHYQNSVALYEALLSLGTAREQARMVLPTALYTKFIMQMNLSNLFNLLRQRLDYNTAQWEAVKYAEAISDIVKQHCPVAYESFLKKIKKS